MGDRRKIKGKVMYNSEPSGPQPAQAQPVQTQHTQTVTIQQPRVIYGKQMPMTVQQVQQDMPQQNVRIIYAQQPPMQVQMQVQGDPNVRTAYVLSNQAGDGTIKTDRDGQISENVRIIYAHQPPMQVQMQMQDPNNVRRITHLGLNALQVNPDGSLVNRGEPVVCEVDLRQYQQMQVVQPQQHHSGDEHMRATVMTGSFQGEMQAQLVDQSQQTPAMTTFSLKKKEKVLLPCLHCKDSFRTQCQLQAHIRNKHIKPFKCDSCWKAFSFESQLKLHVTTHTGEKPYQCDVCPKAYARKTALFNHVRVHARKKFFKCCKYCGKGFKNEEKLEKHERMHSMSDERKYVTLEMFVDKPV